MSRKPDTRTTRRRAASPRFTPASTRLRHDGWTPERQLGFIDALAASGCVAEACAAVGMSRSAAYQLRVRPEAQQFRMAWDAALDLAIRRLADACFSRALNGVPVPHFYQGEQVGEHRRYNDRLAMFLLRYRDPLRYAATLDEMVYSGHPEGAGIRFAHARNAVHDEAERFPEGEQLPGRPPYDLMMRDEWTARSRKAEQDAAAAAKDATRQSLAAKLKEMDGRLRRDESEMAAGPGGDVASISSTSAACRSASPAPTNPSPPDHAPVSA